VRKTFFTIVTAAAATAAVAMGSAPAALAASGPTDTTFTLSSTGLLSITTPDTADLGTGSTSDPSISGDLGNVTVTDARSPDNGTWTVTVSMETAFHVDGGGVNETIPDADVSYDPGTGCTESTGNGTFAAGVAGDLAAPRTAFSASALFGDNSCTWDPAITVTIPSGSPAGDYSGTILHSVSA
jgi:hypothetical protein